jgi:phosphatidylserine/phosphatidylglycerophosphate/cardiolipin synthase-like enzyme
VAAYSLDLWGLRDALINAHRRGVAVRMVMESDNLDAPEVGDPRSAAIPIAADRREYLMHHKFVIIDRLEVWMGSMNFTIGGAYFNDNNLLAIRSSHLARDFIREFEEMYIEDCFGALSRADTPYPSVKIDGTFVEVYFAPEDGVAERVIELIRQAEKSIYFMAFSFTSDAIASAMIERAQAGVEVRGLMDASGAASVGSEYSRLHQAGVDVRNVEGDGRMHHKVIVVDEEVVITGSYNFTRSAEVQNDENLLAVHLPSLTQQYLIEFNRLLEMDRN